MDRYKSLPLARSEGLIVEEVGDELLIYDTETKYGHCLSPAAASIWHRCDGVTTIDRLCAGESSLDRETVDRALAELALCELLEVAKPERGTTRRQLSSRAMKIGAAAVAAPLVLSVAAPTAMAAVTLNFCLQFSSINCGSGDSSEGCKTNGCCCCTPPVGPNGFKNCVDTFANCPTQQPAANSCN